MAGNSWLGELNVGMFGGVGRPREGFFFYYRSMKFDMLINRECRDVDLFAPYTAEQYLRNTRNNRK